MYVVRHGFSDCMAALHLFFSWPLTRWRWHAPGVHAGMQAGCVGLRCSCTMLVQASFCLCAHLEALIDYCMGSDVVPRRHAVSNLHAPGCGRAWQGRWMP